jgi:hypothetical protein
MVTVMCVKEKNAGNVWAREMMPVELRREDGDVVEEAVGGADPFLVVWSN